MDGKVGIVKFTGEGVRELLRLIVSITDAAASEARLGEHLAHGPGAPRGMLGNPLGGPFNVAQERLADISVLRAVPKQVLCIDPRTTAVGVVAHVCIDQLGFEKAVRGAYAASQDALEHTSLILGEERAATILGAGASLKQPEGCFPLKQRRDLPEVLPWVAMFASGVIYAVGQVLQYDMTRSLL